MGSLLHSFGFSSFQLNGNVISGEEIVVSHEQVLRADTAAHRQYEMILEEPLNPEEEHYLGEVDLVLGVSWSALRQS